MNKFNVVTTKTIYKHTGSRTLIYGEGKFVEVVGLDGFKMRGTISKVEDEYIFIKNKINEVKINISDLVDIISKNPNSI